jgi:hypothetical protein
MNAAMEDEEERAKLKRKWPNRSEEGREADEEDCESNCESHGRYTEAVSGRNSFFHPIYIIRTIIQKGCMGGNLAIVDPGRARISPRKWV